MPTKAELDATFDILVTKAIAGERCPENDTFGIRSELVIALCHAGRVRTEISGHNYRTVVILEGEHAGKSTSPNPRGAKPWKIIDATGTRRIVRIRSSAHQQPSAPQLLSHASRQA